MKISLETRRAIQGCLFISLWIFGFAAFMAWPLYESLRLSFFKLLSLAGFRFAFIGAGNYTEAFFEDAEFIPILLRTFLNSIVDIPIILIFSLFVAILVNRNLKGQGIFRAILFLPVIIGSGMVIRQLMQGNTAIMPLLGHAGLSEIGATYLGPGLVNQVIQIMNRITMVLWRSGIQILIFLAGLQGISSTLYEAAKVDGATEWESFWKITLPMISSIMLVNIIYTIVDSYADIFNEVLSYIYLKAYGESLFSGEHLGGAPRLGYAAALGWIYFIIIFAFILVILAWFRKRVYYAGGE